MTGMKTCDHHDGIVVHSASDRCPLCITTERIAELNRELSIERSERETVEKQLTAVEDSNRAHPTSTELVLRRVSELSRNGKRWIRVVPRTDTCAFHEAIAEATWVALKSLTCVQLDFHGVYYTIDPKLMEAIIMSTSSKLPHIEE
jgi:hypothetical protein